MSVLQKNKKVAAGIGITAVAAAALALGAGTFAAFSDTETGPSGTLAAATLDLTVGKSESTTAFDATNIAPGYQSPTSVLTFRNEGTIPGTLSVAFLTKNAENTCVEPEAVVDMSCGDADGELGQSLIISIEGNGFSYTGPLKDLPKPAGTALPAMGSVSYKMFFTLPKETGNEVQSDSVQVTTTGTLEQ